MLQIGALAATVALLITLNTQLRLQMLRFPSPPAQEEVQRWNPDLFKTAAFGHWPAALDWMWIKTLVDTSVSHVAPGTHPSVYYNLDLISDLDPADYDIYPAGANLLAVIRADGVGARDLLLKGDRFAKEKLPSYGPEFEARYWPARWQIPLLLAYAYLFELGDMPHAAERFEEASRMPGSPAYLQPLADRLRHPGGQYDVGLRLLSFMIAGADDPDAKRELEDKKSALLQARFLYELNREFVEYFKHAGAVPGERVLHAFFERQGLSSRDPVGGALSWDPKKGRIVSSTPQVAVFGLE